MITFIIQEEKEEYKRIFIKEIEKVMMNYDIDYEIKSKDNIPEETFKIFILNIDLSKEDCNFPEQIRYSYEDWQSMIIIVSKNNQKKQIMYDKRLLLVDYINLSEPFEERFKTAIQIALKNHDRRPNSLKYTYRNIFYNIDFCKILYIEKEKDNKRCIIHTIDQEYYIQGCLGSIEKQLDKRFLKCNRSYIVNTEQILMYNRKKNEIIFKNQEILLVNMKEQKKLVTKAVRKIDS